MNMDDSVKKWHCSWCGESNSISKKQFVKFPIIGNFMMELLCQYCNKKSFHYLSEKERKEHQAFFCQIK